MGQFYCIACRALSLTELVPSGQALEPPGQVIASSRRQRSRRSTSDQSQGPRMVLFTSASRVQQISVVTQVAQAKAAESF